MTKLDRRPAKRERRLYLRSSPEAASAHLSSDLDPVGAPDGLVLGTVHMSTFINTSFKM